MLQVSLSALETNHGDMDAQTEGGHRGTSTGPPWLGQAVLFEFHSSSRSCFSANGGIRVCGVWYPECCALCI